MMPWTTARVIVRISIKAKVMDKVRVDVTGRSKARARISRVRVATALLS